jgi:hypothetical protein
VLRSRVEVEQLNSGRIVAFPLTLTGNNMSREKEQQPKADFTCRATTYRLHKSLFQYLHT